MSASSSTGNDAPTPDALRLTRLDRIIDAVGEHQLSIRQHGVSVTDLSQRLKNVETRMQTDFDSLLCLKEVDISGQLAALHSTIKKMQRQATTRAREQEDARLAQELRLQQLEQHHAATTISLRQLEQQVDDSIAQQEADLEELAQTMRGMMSQTVSRIADQFDAVQASLEEEATHRATDRAEQQQAGEALHREIAETRTWTEAHATSLRSEVSELIRAETQAAAAQAAEQATMLEVVQRQIAFETKREAQADRLSSLEEAQSAAEIREAKGSQMIQEALTVWQQAMDEKLNDASSKFDEYKNYVRRLRHEMREMKEESDLTHAALVDALARELQGLGNGVALLQNDAAGLLGQLRKNNNPKEGDKVLQPEVSSSSTQIT